MPLNLIQRLGAQGSAFSPPAVCSTRALIRCGGERSVRRMDVRYALLLHGLAGTWDQSPSESLHARGGPRKASRRLIRFCAETHLAHIVRAVGAPVDVFIHTWHPELATFIDGIYGEALRGSQHEPVRSKLPKAQSQALSIGKVAALALSHGSIAKLALVLRLDLAVLEPPRLDLFNPAAATTAQWCCLGSARSSLQVQAAVQAACGAADLQLRSSEPASARWKQRVFRRCTVWRIRGQNRRMGVRNISEDDARVLHDQWIAAPLAVLQRWLELASQSGWESVRRRSVQMHLSRTGRYLWSHEVWPLWLQQLNVSSRFHPWRTTLGRFALPWAWARAPMLEACSQVLPAGAVRSSKVEDEDYSSTVQCPVLSRPKPGRPLRSGRYCCGRTHRLCGARNESESACEAVWRGLQPMVSAAATVPEEGMTPRLIWAVSARALVVGATRWALRNSTCPAFEEDANFNKKAGLVASGRAICRDGELVPSISAPAEISQLWALEAKFCTFNKELHQPKCTFRKARRLPSGW